MSAKKKLHAIFFDFDGVIVDSTAVKEKAFYTLFAETPQIMAQLLRYHRKHGGISRVEKIAWAHRQLLAAPLSESELASWAERYSTLVLDKVAAVPYITGAVELLEYYSKQSEIHLFIVSGTPEEELQKITQKRGLDKYFTAVCGSPEKKPAIIKRKLHRYNLTPANCLFIGDAMTDYNSAKETGLEFIGIAGALPFPDGTTVCADCSGVQEKIAERFSL